MLGGGGGGSSSGPGLRQRRGSGAGGGGALASLDMYRKVPTDLLEGSRQGSIISIVAICLMLGLFVLETKAFFWDDRNRLKQELVLDRNLPVETSTPEDVKIRVDFNITMMDMKCEHVTIDVVSVWGKEQENVTKDIHKWTVDAEGVQQQYLHRNLAQHDLSIELEDSGVTETLEELEEDGQDAVNLSPNSLAQAIEIHEYVFVDFYASWCSHCQKLAPTWEALAEVMFDASHAALEEKHGDKVHDYSEEAYEQAIHVELPVMIAKVDCVEHSEYCNSLSIRGYPTLRLYVKGQHYADYRGSRTVLDLVQFLHVVEERTISPEERQARALDEGFVSNTNLHHAEAVTMEKFGHTDEEKVQARGAARSKHYLHTNKWVPGDHPGCQVAGSLLLNRVPGNFYIRAQAPHTDLAPHMTNVSHEVHRLSFRPEFASHLPFKEQKATKNSKFHWMVPDEIVEHMTPMNGNVYITENRHQAHHHYFKLVTTNEVYYQVVSSSQLAEYTFDQVPEAKFLLDLSPIAVRYWYETKRPWYRYITSLMAILGGAFTVVGMLETSFRRTVEWTRKTSNPLGQNTPPSAPPRQRPPQQAMAQEQRQLHYS